MEAASLNILMWKNGQSKEAFLVLYGFVCILDTLILSLVNSRCYVGHNCMSVFVYADDLVILAPAARKLLSICDEYATNFDIILNTSKSKFLLFRLLVVIVIVLRDVRSVLVRILDIYWALVFSGCVVVRDVTHFNLCLRPAQSVIGNNLLFCCGYYKVMFKNVTSISVEDVKQYTEFGHFYRVCSRSGQSLAMNI